MYHSYLTKKKIILVIFFFLLLFEIYSEIFNKQKNNDIISKKKYDYTDEILSLIKKNYLDDELIIFDKNNNLSGFELGKKKNKSLKFDRISNFSYFIDNIDQNNGILFKSNYHKSWQVYFINNEKDYIKVHNILTFYPFENYFLKDLIYTFEINHTYTINNFNFFYSSQKLPSKFAIIYFKKNIILKNLFYISILCIIFLILIILILKKKKYV